MGMRYGYESCMSRSHRYRSETMGTVTNFSIRISMGMDMGKGTTSLLSWPLTTVIENLVTAENLTRKFKILTWKSTNLTWNFKILSWKVKSWLGILKNFDLKKWKLDSEFENFDSKVKNLLGILKILTRKSENLNQTLKFWLETFKILKFWLGLLKIFNSEFQNFDSEF